MNELQEIKYIVRLLNEGKVILYPTDTVWGLGCDALNEKAVKRLFQIKQRMEDKSVITLIDSVERLDAFTDNVENTVLDLLSQSHVPQTVIFPSVKNLPNGVINQNRSGAFRLPKHEFCLNLLKEFQKPLVSTSANVSGDKTPLYFNEISQEIKEAVDYIVPHSYEGNMTHKPSQIIFLSQDGEIQFLRK